MSQQDQILYILNNHFFEHLVPAYTRGEVAFNQVLGWDPSFGRHLCMFYPSKAWLLELVEEVTFIELLIANPVWLTLILQGVKS